MHKMYQYIAWVLLFMCAMCAVADTVDLTVGSVAVTNRSQQALFKAAPQALRQVLIQVSGNPDIMSDPTVRSVLPQADQLIQTFSYTTQQVGNQAQLMVNIHFDQAVLNKVLRQANQTVLHTANRPMTLAWINLDDHTNSPNTILSSDESSPVISALQRDASRLGLSVILPAMDLQDQAYVKDNAELSFDTHKLAAAAERYHVSSILAGNVSRAVDGSWQGEWLFVSAHQPHQWNTVGATPQLVLTAALTDMNNIISSTLAVHNDPKLQSAVTVQVTGVNSLDDYALVMDDFKQLNVVAHIGVAQFNGATMLLQLRVIGGKDALVAALQHNASFVNTVASTTAATAAGNSDVSYQFQENTDANMRGVS